MIAMAKLVDSAERELDFVRADSSKQAARNAELSDALRTSLKRQTVYESRIRDLENQIQTYEESKHFVRELEARCERQEHQKAVENDRISTLLAMNNLLTVRSQKVEAALSSYEENAELSEQEIRNLGSKICGLEQWGGVLEAARQDAECARDEFGRDMKSMKIQFAKDMCLANVRVSEANAKCVEANQKILALSK